MADVKIAGGTRKIWAAMAAFLTILAMPVFGQERVALVIGNSAYEHVQGLVNPINDAQDIGATLENLGFAVTRVLDANKGRIRQAVDEFQARAAQKGTEVALFYYAGHGVEHEGINYIIPVNARIEDEYQLLDQGVSLERVTLGLEKSRAAFNMVVLDACRDNPFFKSRSSGGRGLAAMSGGGRSMIVFATSPGEVAADGRERNSPFTRAFIQHAATPGLEVSAMMRQVNGTVQELTGGKQIPWFNVSYTGEVYLGDAEALSDLSARAGAVGQELSALEADIARIQKQLAAADSEAEKKRLKAEERRARAAEAAKRLQAEQLSEIEAKARQALERSRADDALRRQMETQLAAQRVNLSQQAEKRRKELEELRRRDGESQGVWDQFEAIGSLSKTIADINGRFDAMAVSLEEKMNGIIAEREAAIEKDNPKQPFETQKEYEAHIAGLKAEARTEWQADLKARKAEQSKARREELADLRKELGQQKRELNGSQFTLDMNAVEVKMARFDAETKVFPLKVQGKDERFTFAVPVSLKLKSRERQALGEEYFRIYSADQSGGLAGEIAYTVEQIYPDIWTLKPTKVRVVNLLENDRELARSSRIEEGMVVSTAGRAEPLAAVVRLESDTEKAEVWVGGKLIGATPLVYPLPAGSASGALRAEFRWPGGEKRVFSIALRSGVNASAAASPQGLERRWGRADTDRLGLAVEGLSPADKSRTNDATPTLSWKAASGAAGYQVQMASSRGGVRKASPVGVASRRGNRGAYTPAKPLKGVQTHYWRVRAVDGNGHFGNWSEVASIIIEYAVGDTGPAGGIVFYDKGSYSGGWRYLEAAPSDQGKVQWGGYGTTVGGTSTAIGSGNSNTEKIVNKLGSGNYAAKICYDLVLGGHDDWFLPSKDELNELYKQRTTVGGFASDRYWSSSEYSSDYAWVQRFGNGFQYDYYKYADEPVRAVRAF